MKPISAYSAGQMDYKNRQIKPTGDNKLNPKVELKNINSFRAVEKAINYEVERQIKALAEGEKLFQETRGWDESRSITFSQRVKETSADYRYFPEPDIPPLTIDPEWVDEIRKNLTELPPQKKKRFIDEYNLNEADAEILSGDSRLADYTEEVISELRAWIDSTGDTWERQKHKLAKIVANWLINELFKHLKTDNKTIKRYQDNTGKFRRTHYPGISE